MKKEPTSESLTSGFIALKKLTQKKNDVTLCALIPVFEKLITSDCEKLKITMIQDTIATMKDCYKKMPKEDPRDAYFGYWRSVFSGAIMSLHSEVSDDFFSPFGARRKQLGLLETLSEMVNAYE